MAQIDTAQVPYGLDEQTDARCDRVAVIVVHGVADQVQGETAQSLVDLLVLSELDSARYVAVDSREFVVPVGAVPATLPAASLDEAPDPAAEDALDVGGDIVDENPDRRQRIGKALAQSLRSDFQRSGKVAAPTVSSVTRTARATVWRAITRPARPAAAAAHATPLPPIEPHAEAAATPPVADRGLQFTQFLLRKANRNGAGADSYRVKRTGLERFGQAHSRVDVYEMYWADLSRLSGAMPRIVSELFTLIFRLSRLGRETVDEASRHSTENRQRRRRHWTLLAVTQTMLDWLFVNGLAVLFSQLLLVAILVMVVGAAAANPLTPFFVAMALVVCGVANLGYAALVERPWTAIHGGHLSIVVLGLAMSWPPLGAWGLGFVAVALLSVAYRAGLGVASDRFPFVLTSGMLWWFFIVGVFLGSLASTLFRMPDAPPWAHLMQAALSAFEWTLGLIKTAWIVFAIPFVVWTIATTAAAWGDNFDARASAGTGRLGLLGSLTMFLMLAMAVWAGLRTPLEWSTTRFEYAPSFWTSDVAPPTAETAAECALEPRATPDARAAPATSAPRFLCERYRRSTETFAILALLLLLLPGTYLVVAFVPSVVAELKWFSFVRDGDPARDARARDGTRRLGRWLTIGYELLDGFILGCVVIACAVAVVTAALFVLQEPLTRFWPGLESIESAVAAFSQQFLKPLVFSAASGFAALSLFGRALSRYVPGLRGPLDAALDVDNYLREFPRRSIPRARIFARYRALLALVRAEAYDRVVIVSHSQGTVISAELLRFLSSDSSALVRSTTRSDRLEALLGCKTRLLTMGCPLRQLYAARFPTLYHWILNSDGAAIGPTAADLGVETWANAFTSGDYVGRWLWSGTPKARLAFPTTDTVHGSALDRAIAYDRFRPAPPALPSLAGLSEFETCVGYGAHTHYFEPGQLLVAAIVDHLIADPGTTTAAD